ncbi:NAD-dependent epimerase/dehydratase family protein [Nafulsella turpanensis]|uniref:NAD-dependent epimerase/dehydratase family protein n=1 Tax=Nafulsella turpanensis TaxID=1265690 RepID=UPI00034ADC10|nr:NAD-dependent epimerase/dehydratase family protein [Nafulsella turpanensis]
MSKQVLITGGAGFIGSHLANELINNGYRVKILDNLLEQVHGKDAVRPDYLHPEAELIRGDVRTRKDLISALEGVQQVYHFAARVGVGQSMYEIREYTDVNNMGTATLLEVLIENPVEKLVVASSMSIYGEGMYVDSSGKRTEGSSRGKEQLKEGKWELYDEQGEALKPVATPESKNPTLASVYALSKYDQERLCLMVGSAYNIPTVALRFFNAYGPHQALSNPYTGVLAIFASRFLNNKSPLIFEDGQQQRDFISVYDIARACRLAMETPEADGEVFNVGSGQSYTIQEVAEKMAKVMNKQDIKPEITGKYRVGDIRHCYADISKAKRILGFEPSYTLEQGMEELAEWLKGQIAVDKVADAKQELEARGLTV